VVCYANAECRASALDHISCGSLARQQCYWRLGGCCYERKGAGYALNQVKESVTTRKTQEPAPARGALKLRDACEYLGGLSVPTMHRLIGRGLIRPNRSLRHLLFPITELDRFLREGMG
jgi:Helix-turn-helix domain